MGYGIGKPLLYAVAMGVSAVPVAAQEARYAHTAITAGELSQAERSLEREARAGSREPEVLLNLAAVYALRNRTDDARALYGRVLNGEDASMVLSSNRVASAHDVARTGLRLLGRTTTTQLTAR